MTTDRTARSPRSRDVALYRRMLQQARPYWRLIPVLFAVDLLASPIALLAPVPLKIAVDSVIGSHPVPGFLDPFLPASGTGLLVATAAMLLALGAISQVQSAGSALLRTSLGEKLLIDFRTRLFGQAQRLSLRYHDSKGTADSAYRIQYDAMSIQTLAISSVASIATATFTLVMMIYVTIRLDYGLALIALSIIPLLLGVSRFFALRLRTRSRSVKKVESSALAILQEVLTSIRVVKAFGREDDEQERFRDRSYEGLRARIGLAVVEGAFGLVLAVVTAVGTSAVLLVGVRHVQSGVLTLGELLLVMTYLTQLYSPLKTISRKLGSLQSSLAGAERAFEILDAAPEVPERPDARSLDRADGAIEFRSVSFAYDRDPVLHDVSFVVAPGKRLGIAGKTGAGKTTIASLIMRFYDPTSGQVMIDGRDVREYKLTDLRNQISLVLQDAVLLSTTIGENIAYGRPGCSFSEIEAAAKAAHAHDFIVALPDGYDTQVGERGMRLSGGERQRISLARAFLKDAPILILDEPTSAVDIATEERIVEAMRRLSADRTTILVSHRPSTLEICDEIIRLDHGGVIEPRGPSTTHPSLPRQSRNGDRALREHVERIVGETFGRGSTISSIERKRSDYSSWYDSFVIDVRVSGRRPLRIFLKDFSSPRAQKDAMAARREREAGTYQELLAGQALGTAEFYGVEWNEDENRLWMFLEYVPGWPLRYRDFSYWIEAARWLGRFHGAFANRPLRHKPFLVRHDAQFFEERALKAAEAAAVLSKDVAYRLAPIIDGYTPVVAAMTSQPDVLVHGGFRPVQVIVNGANGSTRICPVDWERAATGSGYYDLAALLDGFDVERRDLLLANYRREATANGWVVPPDGELLPIIDCHRLDRVMNWIGKAPERGYDPATVAKLIDMAAESARAVLTP